MQMRPLGRSGLQVAPLAFGGNVFGWTADEATSFALLDAFVDAGFNLVDTADIYSSWVPGHAGGESEAIIGRWLKATGKRDRIVTINRNDQSGIEVGQTWEVFMLGDELVEESPRGIHCQRPLQHGAAPVHTSSELFMLIQNQLLLPSH